MPCQVRELWEGYDHDKDGFIDRAEVRQMLESGSDADDGAGTGAGTGAAGAGAGAQ